MTSRRFLAAAAMALCLFQGTASAQEYVNTPVTVSSEKVKSNGAVYYSHIVLDHQTLYSISKAYGVTYQEIIDANKAIDLAGGGLKAGQVLLIPDKGTLPSEQTQSAASAPAAAAAASAPQVQQSTGAAPAPQDGEYILYTVKWYEDLAMIASRFDGVTKEMLMTYNGLTSLKPGRKQVIKIPLHPERLALGSDAEAVTSASAASKADQETAVDTNETNKASDIIQSGIEAIESLAQEAGEKIRSIFKPKSDEISVAVVLPFNAKAKVNDSAYDLYSGILMALKDLGDTGIKTKVQVFDSKNAAVPVKESDLEDCDLVIGPIAPEDIRQILAICPSSTAVVSPLDPKAASLTAEHENLIQAPSTTDNQLNDVIKWISEDKREGDKVILITQKGVYHPLTVKANESELSFERLDYGILEGRAAINRLETMMTHNGQNRVVIASDEEAFVNDAVRNLNLMTFRKFDVVLYAPSKIRNYETIEVESLHNINTHASCSYYVDYDSDRIKSFLLTYRALFGAEPTPFAYQGYDAAYYFVRNYATPETHADRITRMENRKFRGLQSDFLMQPGASDKEGYSNVGVRRVVYGADFSIRLQN